MTRPAAPPGEPRVVDLAGVRLHAVTEEETCRRIMGASEDGRGGMVVTVNLDHLRRCRTSPSYRGIVASAELAVPDGVPLLWAARVAGTPLPGLVAGSNLISSLSRAAAERGRSVYLLGGNPGAAEGAARVLAERSPGLVVAGTACPPMGFDRDAVATARISDALAAAAPHVVFVGLGSPKQEELIARLRGHLPYAWWIGVGISFSYLTGDVRRAPVWMRRMGLEWLHRLVSEPSRLARRYLVEGLPFAVRLFAWAVRRRFRGGSS